MSHALQSCGPGTQWKNRPNDKHGKLGKTWKICPDRNWRKHGCKIPKKWRIGPIFHFFGVFRHFFSIFRPFFFCPHFQSGQIFHVFPIFSPFFVVRPVFHCVPGPHDCKTCTDNPPPPLLKVGTVLKNV